MNSIREILRSIASNVLYLGGVLILHVLLVQVAAFPTAIQISQELPGELRESRNSPGYQENLLESFYVNMDLNT